MHIIFILCVLHCRLMTQLADQPGFGWNSCDIFFLFLFFWQREEHCAEVSAKPGSDEPGRWVQGLLGFSI